MRIHDHDHSHAVAVMPPPNPRGNLYIFAGQYISSDAPSAPSAPSISGQVRFSSELKHNGQQPRIRLLPSQPSIDRSQDAMYHVTYALPAALSRWRLCVQIPHICRSSALEPAGHALCVYVAMCVPSRFPPLPFRPGSPGPDVHGLRPRATLSQRLGSLAAGLETQWLARGLGRERRPQAEMARARVGLRAIAQAQLTTARWLAPR